VVADRAMVLEIVLVADDPETGSQIILEAAGQELVLESALGLGPVLVLASAPAQLLEQEMAACPA
jgi:hypothetical protein